MTPVIGWTTHHSIVEYKGKWYLFHHDSAPSGGRTWLRSLKVCELEYDDNGKIITIEGLDTPKLTEIDITLCNTILTAETKDS